MVREAWENDLQRIAEITVFGKRTAYRDIFRNDRFSFGELTVVGLYNELLGAPETWKNMLVYDDGIIKGVIGFVHVDSETAELCGFYVEPVFKGQGIGRELLGALLDKLRENYKKVILWVIKENYPARRFYEMNGFSETGNERLIEGTEKLDTEYIRNIDK